MKLFYLLVFISCTGIPAFGQLTLSAPSVVAKKGNIASVGLTAISTDSVSAMQFSISWDSLVLKYLGVANFGLGGLDSILNFGRNNTASGKLTFVWTDSTTHGTKLKGNTPIFQIVFQVIGNPGDTTALSYGNSPTKITAYDSKSNPVVVTTQSGKLTVSGLVATADIAQHTGFSLYPNYPNPANANTNISFELERAANVDLAIADMSGIVAFEQHAFYDPGHHIIQVDRTKDWKPGMYFYTLRALNQSLTGKMIFEN